jgi:hypothetical protein
VALSGKGGAWALQGELPLSRDTVDGLMHVDPETRRLRQFSLQGRNNGVWAIDAATGQKASLLNANCSPAITIGLRRYHYAGRFKFADQQ